MAIRDKYTDAIDRIIRQIYEVGNPALEVIDYAWGNPTSIGPGCLFQFVTRTGNSHRHGIGERRPGCLSMLRDSETFEVPVVSEAVRFVEQWIREDDRLPKNMLEITEDDPSESELRERLEVFAEWQRRLDRTIRQGKRGDYNPAMPVVGVGVRHAS